MSATAAVTLGQGLTCQAVPPSKDLPSLADDARSGLVRPPRELPPKYFYDAFGSVLFDRICDRPEYYPTRTEDALLARHAGDLIEHAQPERIVELGSGTSRKTRRLFDACARSACRPIYAPFDVCREMLIDAGRELIEHYGWLEVEALVGDYMGGLEHLPTPGSRTLYLFLGGTIGNLHYAEAEGFLRELRAVMGPEDRLLIGADRLKDPAVLHAAYNDAGGVTREFNRNVLRVLNRELDADFDVEGFEHYACFNPAASRVEMHLVSLRAQAVTLGGIGESVDFREGDSILTEVSCKYTRERLEGLLNAAGFAVASHFEPDNQYFSLVVAEPAGHARAATASDG